MNVLIAYTLYFIILILLFVIVYGTIIYERYSVLKYTDPHNLSNVQMNRIPNSDGQKSNGESQGSLRTKNTENNSSAGQTTLGDLGYECINWSNKNLALKINSEGNVECASVDGKNCIANCEEVYDLLINYGNPLVCGEEHYQLYNFTGYDDKSHWCSQYRDIKADLPLEKDILPNYNSRNIKHGDTIVIKGGRNSKYCADDSRAMQCNRAGVDFWEKFIIERKRGEGIVESGDIIFIKGFRKNMYCSYDEDQTIRCNSTFPGLWEKFVIENVDQSQYINSNNEILLKSLKTQLYCSDVYAYRTNNKKISCEKEKDKIGNWEKFRIEKI